MIVASRQQSKKERVGVHVLAIWLSVWLCVSGAALSGAALCVVARPAPARTKDFQGGVLDREAGKDLSASDIRWS